MNNFRTLIQRDLKTYSKYIPEINKSTMRSLFKCEFTTLQHYSLDFHIFLMNNFLVCVAFLENKQYSKEAYDREVAKLIANNPDSPRNYEIYVTILMTLIETFSRSRRTGDDIAEILRELKFQEECVEDLTKVLTANHETLAESVDAMYENDPLKNFEYRIDISRVDER